MVEFDAWLRKFASDSDEPFVRQAEEMLSYFFALASQFPPQYGWRVMDSSTESSQRNCLARNTRV